MSALSVPLRRVGGERLELSRLSRPSDATRCAFRGAVAVFAAGVMVTLVAPHAGMRLGGAGFVALALWFALGSVGACQAGGVLNVTALLPFIGSSAIAVAAGRELIPSSVSTPLPQSNRAERS